MKKKIYNILSLSGGKDSSALAFFIKNNMPELHKNIEYVFADTEHEIPETYDYLNKIEVFTGKTITRLKPYKSFDDLLIATTFLPSHSHRWCTILLKTQTFRHYIQTKFKQDGEEGIVNLYIGIRADERDRAKASGQDNLINEKFPFIEYNINKQDVEDLLINEGIGYPDYYKWRKRSGCYFCFYQSCMDWINLYENHPDLYKKAMEYEYTDCDKIKSGRMGFNMKYSLKDMIKPENIKKIKEDYKKLQDKRKEQHKAQITNNLFRDFIDEDDFGSQNLCKFCHL